MIISESYLHFDFPSYRDPLEVGEFVFPFVEYAASHFFLKLSDKRRTEIIIVDGSIRLKGLISISAKVLIGYGSIRSGIDYLAQDGKAAANWVNRYVQEQLKLPNDAVIARRVRTPGPTRLLRLYENVRSGTMSPEEATRRANKLFIEYGESDGMIHELIVPMSRELQLLAPQNDKVVLKKKYLGGAIQETHSRRETFPDERVRPLVVPARRFRIVRDSSGRIKVIDESG
ncbi:MAG: hypothetical protein HGA99_02320 [Chlorobiaceae bacterium]|nr:hypothetical protein [Chlorobiaceae bacterium]